MRNTTPSARSRPSASDSCSASITCRRSVRAVGFVGCPAEETHRHVLDHEDEVVARVEHGEPVARACLRRALQALLAERIGAAADRPAVIAHLGRGHPNRVAAGIRQQPRAKAQSLVGQRGMDLPWQDRRCRQHLARRIRHARQCVGSKRSDDQPPSSLTKPRDITVAES